MLARRKGSSINNPVIREELLGVANLALVRAAHLFDKSRGLRFVTLLNTVVTNAFRDFLRDEDFMQPADRKKLKALEAGARKQDGSLTLESLSEALEAMHDLTPDEKVFLQQAARRFLGGTGRAVVYLDEVRSMEGGNNIVDELVSDEDTPEFLLIKENVAQVVRDRLSALPEKMRRVLQTLVCTDDDRPTRIVVGDQVKFPRDSAAIRRKGLKQLRNDPKLQNLAM